MPNKVGELRFGQVYHKHAVVHRELRGTLPSDMCCSMCCSIYCSFCLIATTDLMHAGKNARKCDQTGAMVSAMHHHRALSSIHPTLTEYSTCPTTGESVVKGYMATLGFALVMQPSRVDLPAFGYPTSPMSAIVRSSKR